MGTSKLSGKPDEMLGGSCDGLASHPGGVAILLIATCYGNWDKLRQLCEPGSWLSLFLFHFMSVYIEDIAVAATTKISANFVACDITMINNSFDNYSRARSSVPP